MDSRHLVDPELLPMLEAWPPLNLTDDNLAEVRAAELPMPPVDKEGTELEIRKVPGPDGAPEIALHIYSPAEAEGPLPCIFHIHGGGYVMGAAADLEFIHRPLVRELGCVLVSVEYRLAPETRFPGAIEDCYAGLGWVFANADELGIDRNFIGVTGESAGGGLAASLALLARDRGNFPLAFQHLVYPMIDDRTCVREPHPYAGEFVWPPANNHFGWKALLGVEPGSANVSPYAAAARAEDLSGLPPAFITTGALDLFVDENIAYAQRLIRAGVPVELHVYPGAFHGYDFALEANVTRSTRATSEAALRRFLFESDQS